jgi:hypothetical protein
MIHVFVDESIQARGGFIVSCMVFSKKDPNDLILRSLIKNGFTPNDEYKSGVNFGMVPGMALVRNDLKKILFNHCKIGITILPSGNRFIIGIETLKGLKQFIEKNNFNENIIVSFDQSYFKNAEDGKKQLQELNINNWHVRFENDSKIVRGIQLADLVAHTCSIMLLDTLGLIQKKVKAGENSGYEPDQEIDIGFELWASIRYLFLHEPFSKRIESPDDFMVNVLSYGLYISDFCNQGLKNAVIKRFATNYLGCIH